MGPDDSEATRERLFAIRAMNGDCPDIPASPRAGRRETGDGEGTGPAYDRQP